MLWLQRSKAASVLREWCLAAASGSRLEAAAEATSIVGRRWRARRVLLAWQITVVAGAMRQKRCMSYALQAWADAASQKLFERARTARARRLAELRRLARILERWYRFVQVCLAHLRSDCDTIKGAPSLAFRCLISQSFIWRRKLLLSEKPSRRSSATSKKRWRRELRLLGKLGDNSASPFWCLGGKWPMQLQEPGDC